MSKRIDESTRCVSILLAFAVFFISLSAGVFPAEPWKFGVIPDTQGKAKGEGYYGVAVHIIDAVVEEMIRQKVDMVVHVGDITDFSTQPAFDTAAEHFKPLLEAGIGFYPVRGNHDMRDPDSAAQFAKAFPGLPGTPGSKGSSPELPGMAGLTYTFIHKNVRFFMLDTFAVGLKDSSKGVDYKPGDFQPWVNRELEKKDFEHVFVVAHKNLIGQSHKDNLFTNSKRPNRYPEMQNDFFKSLQQAGARYYLSGHDHMYYRARIKSPNREHELMQIICGSCCQKFYSPEEPFSLRDIPAAQELQRVGFLVFTVDGGKVTGEYYSTKPFGDKPAKPTWSLRERFGHTTDGKYFEEQNVDMKDFLRYKLVP